MDESKGTKIEETETEQENEKPVIKTEILKSGGVQDSSESSIVDSKEGSNIEVGPKIAINREEYLQAHRDLTFDKNQLQIKNNMLHKRLAEYYRKRKQENVLKPIAKAADLEDKYQQKLVAYDELKEKNSKEIEEIAQKLNDVENQYKSKLQNAENTFDAMQTLERNTGRGLIFSKNGKPIPDKLQWKEKRTDSLECLDVINSIEHQEMFVYKFKAVDRLLMLQRQKFEEMCALRLRYIRARNAVTDVENLIRQLERLGPGLYVAHYEKLSLDYQNYVSKIEEREDELIKNRVKCTEHNQLLSHLREKMHHTEEVIDSHECDLGDAETDNYKAREELTKVKSRRDKLRCDLIEERQKAGLLTRQDLLRDFQDSLDQVEELRKTKQYLEMRIAKATQELQVIRRSAYP